jgi:hypothetical protein
MQGLNKLKCCGYDFRVVYFFNEGESSASFCHQVAAWFPDMFCNMYVMKNHKIAKNLMTTKAREKISADL